MFLPSKRGSPFKERKEGEDGEKDWNINILEREREREEGKKKKGHGPCMSLRMSVCLRPPFGCDPSTLVLSSNSIEAYK